MTYASAQGFLDAALARAWNHGDLRVTRLVGWLSDMGEAVWDERVPTIAIRRTGSRYRLLVGRDFVAQWVQSGSDALFLLLHELSHRVRGDLLGVTGAFDSPATARIHNLAADLVLNADLARRFFPQGVELLARFYDPAVFPANLLVPPDALLAAHGPLVGYDEARYVPDPPALYLEGAPRDPRLPLPLSRHWTNSVGVIARALTPVFESSAGPLAADAAALYAKVWFDTSVRTDEVVEALERLGERCRDLDGVHLLGDHDVEGEPIRLPLTDEEADLLAEGGAGRGAGTGGEEEGRRIAPAKDVRSRALFEAVRRALELDASRSRKVRGAATQSTPIPAPSRRALALAAAGCWPGLFRAEVPGTRTEESAAHVYVDLSGSMQHRWPLLYGLVLHLSDRIGLPVHGFSTTVTDLDEDALRDGRVRTTGGTSLDCVVDHARAAGYRRMVVLTDGDVLMEPRTERALAAGEPELYLIVDRDHQRTCALADLARETWCLQDASDDAADDLDWDDVPF